MLHYIYIIITINFYAGCVTDCGGLHSTLTVSFFFENIKGNFKGLFLKIVQQIKENSEKVFHEKHLKEDFYNKKKVDTLQFLR